MDKQQSECLFIGSVCFVEESLILASRKKIILDLVKLFTNRIIHDIVT